MFNRYIISSPKEIPDNIRITVAIDMIKHNFENDLHFTHLLLKKEKLETILDYYYKTYAEGLEYDPKLRLLAKVFFTDVMKISGTFNTRSGQKAYKKWVKNKKKGQK